MNVKSPPTVVLATYNRCKLREYYGMLSRFPLALLSLSDFPDVVEVEEVGNSFLENAVLKAFGYAAQTGLLTLADDSGLEVDALNGAPGILSSRYAGDGASDADRVSKLLTALSTTSQTDRCARFKCVIAICNSVGNNVRTFEGTCEGQIAMTPEGTNGFGYDPVFIPDGYEKSFGSLPDSTKEQISHRGRALRSATDYLHQLFDKRA